MTLVQKVVLALLPKRWAAAVRAESQEWLLRCPDCGTTRSVWDAGGVRFKAASTAGRVAARCPGCGQVRAMTLERQRAG